jgi:hypothetical protein
VKLNTTQWMDSITGLGANIAILTAKHGCGFTLWPTKSKLPDGSPYGYSVGSKGAAIQSDVLRQFVDSANAAGVGYGFYYSIMKSFYLCHSFSGTNSCGKEVLPGQHNFTDEQYSAIVKEQVTELWTEYGNLTEVWVDSGLGGMGDLMVKLQPNAAGTPLSPTRWCGTESGHPSKDVGPGDIWNTGNGDHGDPNADNWMPKFCDPQLFQVQYTFPYTPLLTHSSCTPFHTHSSCTPFHTSTRTLSLTLSPKEHVWFWEPNLKVRTLAMMIPIYHDIVGRGMVSRLQVQQVWAVSQIHTLLDLL